MTIHPAIASLNGSVSVPGDKSISHRAVMLGAIAEGETVIDGFLMGEDCLSTICCFREMGVSIRIESGNRVRVQGVGLHGLQAPRQALNTGNSGTTTRLLAGLLAGQNFSSLLSGDVSLNSRPMQRVSHPLRQMGAHIEDTAGHCPLHIQGSRLRGIDYRLPVASAQLKSALILAALYADGQTRLHEPAPSRDHTERMLCAMGADIRTEADTVIVSPVSSLRARSLRVPGDLSSAAYFLTAALLIPGSEITICGMGCNPTRTGLIDALQAMGADLTLHNFREESGEPVCDCTARYSELHGMRVDGTLIPRLIDEIPILAVATAFAKGETIIADASELKVKESNRIAAMVSQLSHAGADIVETTDGMIIRGGMPLSGAHFRCWGDHRIAMAMAVCALACLGNSSLDEPEVVAISYPEFFDTLYRLEGRA